MPKTEKDKDPYAIAGAVLDRLAIKSPPAPVEKIAKALGAQVRFALFDNELSGMVYVKDGLPIIGVNALHHPNRQRFTIAHELGHLQLHPEFITATVHVDKQFAESVLKRDTSSASGTERLEVEANQFAAALLMPGFVLDKLLEQSPIDIEDGSAIEVWARDFVVSKA